MSHSTPVQVADAESSVLRSPAKPHRPTFSIACWVLALIAFGQLITVGTALTVRSGQPVEVVEVDREPAVSTPQEPIQPRSLAEILASVGDDPDARAPVRIPAAAPLAAPAPEMIPAPAASNLNHQAIADPRVERLVHEARVMHLEGDMMHALLKLDEASRLDPTEPAVIYHKAMLFEDMGIFPKAADHYQQIQQMGIKAGVYYRLAAVKLIKGMGKGAQKGDIAIGPMKTRKAVGPLAGRHVNVAITMLARPDKVINPDDVEVQVHFYDRVNGGEIKKADTSAEISPTWADSKVDWQDAGNEETLRVSYTIPEADLADAHLLGRREFYGYVVELLYKGEVIDQQAQPRRLHSIHGGKMRPIPDENPDDMIDGPPLDLPLDDNGLLPSIDNGYGDNPRLPPLPTR
ncbi:hypothetical protein NT6N_27490 [Oceaniferula spumae]|uniref:Tetratricopeptide repeat protein n=1 Tax=Oceaniferula spumae TaxID=2979115 RepID=A0AAT9FP44_9BACT